MVNVIGQGVCSIQAVQHCQDLRPADQVGCCFMSWSDIVGYDIFVYLFSSNFLTRRNNPKNGKPQEIGQDYHMGHFSNTCSPLWVV
jgi:hypothetical protein